jgi:hypothetical protein
MLMYVLQMECDYSNKTTTILVSDENWEVIFHEWLYLLNEILHCFKSCTTLKPIVKYSIQCFTHTAAIQKTQTQLCLRS